MFSKDNGKDKLFKIILIISFFLLLFDLGIIVRTGPALTYEFSIYEAYPWYFWVMILLATFCGQIIILGSAITKSKKNYWIFGLCVILVANTLLLFMTVIRGYLVNNDGDTLTHIGYMKDILQTSSIGGNYYPIDHILGVILHLFSGLSFPFLTQIIPPFFSFFFILSMYYVGKIIFPNKFTLLILVIISSVLMLGAPLIYFYPNGQAFLIVPLILYAAFKMYYKTDNIKYHILLLLASFFIVFYHPLVTIMIILILCIFQAIQYILKNYEKRILTRVNYIYTIIIVITTFLSWSKYLSMVTYIATPFVRRILGDETVQSEMQKNIAILSKVNLDPIYLIKLILNIYGQYLIIVVFSLLSLGLIFKSIKDHKTKPDFSLGIMVLGFIVFLTLTVVMLLTNDSFGFERIFAFIYLFSLLLIPTGVYLILYDNTDDRLLTVKKVTKLSIIILFFFSITYFSTFNLYASPIVKIPNVEVTKSEYSGMSTFFSYRNVAIPILEYLPNSYRYYDALYGTVAEKVNIDYYDPNRVPPDHFGYQNENLSRSFYINLQYLLVNDRFREYYPRVYPEFENRWRFFPKDFEQLNFDDQVQKVYSNRNLEIFLISPRLEYAN